MDSSKINKKYTLFLSLALVVFISGCSSGGGSSGGGILSIEAFEPDIQGVEILPGEAVKLSLIVRNTGTEKAEEIEPTITGLDGWGIKVDSCVKFSLNPPNPEFNTPGQSKQCIFSYTAPGSLPLDQTFQPKVSIKYKYKSITVSRIKLVPREKFIIKRDSGEAVESETVFKSRSPIDIDMNTRGQASQIRLLSEGKVNFPLFVTVSNLDTGFVCTDTSCENGLKKIKLKLSTPSTDIEIKTGECINYNEIDLFKGQKGEFNCELEAGASSELAEKLVSITAESEPYFYNIERAGPSLSVKRKVE